MYGRGDQLNEGYKGGYTAVSNAGVGFTQGSTAIPDVNYGGILVCCGSRGLVPRKRTFVSADKSGILQIIEQMRE